MLNKIISNKKGDKLISAYWFVVLVLVAGGVFIMVNSFYNSPYDVREMESSLLADKVIDCIYPGGKISSLVIGPNNVFKESFEDNFMEICSLNFDARNEWDPISHLVKISFYEDSRKTRTLFEVYGGNRNYEEDCYSEESYDELAKCSIKDFYAVSEDNKIFFVEVVTSTGKTEENV